MDRRENEAQAVNFISRERNGTAFSMQFNLEHSKYKGANRMDVENLVICKSTMQKRQPVSQSKSTRKNLNKLSP